jgi:hypothetical protein
MLKILVLSVFLFFANANAGSPLPISYVTCIATAEKPGAPINVFELSLNNRGDYTAQFAIGVASVAQTLTLLSHEFNCSFADADARMFYCTIAHGTIRGIIKSESSLPAPGSKPKTLESYQVEIEGSDFAAALGSTSGQIDFKTLSECKVE